MLAISLANSVPIHDQIVGELRRLIACGQLRTGDELPPVRQLAADLGINLNTVARAYRELTEAGLLASTRGRGTVVIATVEHASGVDRAERDRLASVIGAALADAKIAGLTETETRQLVEGEMKRLWKTE